MHVKIEFYFEKWLWFSRLYPRHKIVFSFNPNPETNTYNFVLYYLRTCIKGGFRVYFWSENYSQIFPDTLTPGTFLMTHNTTLDAYTIQMIPVLSTEPTFDIAASELLTNVHGINFKTWMDLFLFLVRTKIFFSTTICRDLWISNWFD